MPNLTALSSVLADQAGRAAPNPAGETGMLQLVLRETVQVHPATEVNPRYIDHVNLRPFVRQLIRRRLDR